MSRGPKADSGSNIYLIKSIVLWTIPEAHRLQETMLWVKLPVLLNNQPLEFIYHSLKLMWGTVTVCQNKMSGAT